MLDGSDKVAKLINIKSKIWNTQLISQIVNGEDASGICKIPLSIFWNVDKMTWWPTHNGLFLIKWAYALEISKGRRNLGDTLNPQTNEDLWRATWKLDIPGAAKHFLWWACQDIHPTRMNLLKQKVTDSSYVIFGLE